jgi:hypothetical protein
MNFHAEVMCCALCGKPPENNGDGIECDTMACPMGWVARMTKGPWNRLQSGILAKTRRRDKGSDMRDRTTKSIPPWYALQLLAGGGCERLTAGACGDGPQYEADAPYGADRWCDACIAQAGVNWRTSEQTAPAEARPRDEA